MKMRTVTTAALASILGVSAVGLMAHANDDGVRAPRRPAADPPPTLQRGEPVIEHSIARIWMDELLDAIRLNIPRPPVHARNLWHLSIAMYDAWCAYQTTSDPYLVHESGVAVDVELARREAISYAAYRLLKHRFVTGVGNETIQAALDARMDDLGYDKDDLTDVGDSPVAIGNRIAAALIAYGLTDGSNEQGNFAPPDGYTPVNDPLHVGLPGTIMNDPNRWQPLAFDYLVLQNGIIIGFAIQSFICPHWGHVDAFGLTEAQLSEPGLYLDPGPQYQLGTETDAQFKADAVDMIWKSSQLDPYLSYVMDIGPRTNHNNPLGSYGGTGYGTNPVTGQPYAPVPAIAADYFRVLAEFWADGPHSETPPGHWNVIANLSVADNPIFEKRIGGQGPIVDALEWDVKTYFTLNGATHDAAVAAWGIKGHYDGSRPISHVRYLSQNGQSSDPEGPSYHPDGIPLVEDLIEVITEDTAAPGGRHHHLIDQMMLDSSGDPILDPFGNPMLYGAVGDIAVFCWSGYPEDPEHAIGGCGWILGIDWLPYQLPTFVTPPFAGYISGHSTFSRSSAEVLAGITGSPFFPGGIGKYLLEPGYLQFEYGPFYPVELTWATYYDAADEAAVSRIWGGIHPTVDDLPARVVGSQVGQLAWSRAQHYFDGRVSCPADLNGDNTVNVLDLLEVIMNWGNVCDDFCGTGCAGDANGDCMVDVQDMLLIISTWGTSCD